jgi:hypothetical protein
MPGSKQTNTKMPADEAKVAASTRDDRSESRTSSDDKASDETSLMDTVSDPDVKTDPAETVEENGEPFDGNHA